MISKGNVTKEVVEFKRYVGICPVSIVTVNPNKKEHESIFNTTLEEEPTYVQDKEDMNGKSYKQVRISVIFKPEAEIDTNCITMPLFITNQKVHGATSGKYQIVDKYGRFAWATEKEIQNKEIPTYSNGKKADIDSTYRIAFVGEENLTNFIRTFLCIPNVSVWDNESRTMIPNIKVKEEECECRLDVEDLEQLFKGNFQGIKEILGYQPTNKMKVCLGVRTDFATGKIYQTVYTRRFFSSNAKSFNSLQKEINAEIQYANEHGRTINTEYSILPVHEYKVQATNLEQNNVTVSTQVQEDDLPFNTPSSDEVMPWD